MKISEAEKIIRKLDCIRPFVMYMHGCKNANIEQLVENVINNKENFNIYRSNIYSTFVNCGTPKTDFVSRMKDYGLYGDSKLIMIMPQAIDVENYFGCISNKKNITQGDTKHVKIDYCTYAANQYFDNKEPKDIHCLNFAHNKLILGYVNTKTNEFIFNKNCMLFDEKTNFEDAVKIISDLAHLTYFVEVLSERIIYGMTEDCGEDLYAFCKKEYDQSEEKKFYDDIENYKFCNSVNFESIYHKSYNELLNRKKNKEFGL